MVFQKEYDLSPLLLAIVIVCGIIIIVDVASTILHVTWTSVSARRDITPQNKGKK